MSIRFSEILNEFTAKFSRLIEKKKGGERVLNFYVKDVGFKAIKIFTYDRPHQKFKRNLEVFIVALNYKELG